MNATNQPVADKRQRVFIVDDHPITRYGLVKLINDEPDLVVCGEAENAQQALSSLPAARPDLILADITLPGKSGLDFMKDLRTLYPETAVLVLSMHDERIYAERMLRAGARGYVMKSEGGQKLLEAIRQVLQGEVFVSHDVSAAILNGVTRRSVSISDARPGTLTDREFEVFQLIGQGLTTQEIADRLHLGIKTVGTHRYHIKQKLKFGSGPELIRHAVRWAAAQQLV